jgi:hypothetical protein
VTSGLRREAEEICALVGYYAASSGNSLPTFRYNSSVPSSRAKKFKDDYFYHLQCSNYPKMDFFTPADWTGMLSRSVAKELLINAE